MTTRRRGLTSRRGSNMTGPLSRKRRHSRCVTLLLTPYRGGYGAAQKSDVEGLGFGVYALSSSLYLLFVSVIYLHLCVFIPMLIENMFTYICYLYSTCLIKITNDRWNRRHNDVNGRVMKLTSMCVMMSIQAPTRLYPKRGTKIF